MSTVQHSPGRSFIPGREARSDFMAALIDTGATIGKAIAKAERLSGEQLRVLQLADERDALLDHVASVATWRSLLSRGLVVQPHTNYASDATQIFYVTDFGRAAIAKATGVTS